MVGDADPRTHDGDDPVLVEPLSRPDRGHGAPPPRFGRTPGSPERLAGVSRGATARPDVLLTQLESAVRSATTAIRKLSVEERGKRGVNSERGELTVAEVIESFIVGHAEEHLAQVHSALRR
jgi:hypothetical protein